MWLNNERANDSAINAYRKRLKGASPKCIVIDNLFNASKLDKVLQALQQPDSWQTQQHTYQALYVNQQQWYKATSQQRFVQRDVWQRDALYSNTSDSNSQAHSIAHAFLSYLRSDEFLALLSRIFKVQITDINVANPDINTNYFRLSPLDFVGEHADDSPGREVCMLLYLNKNWHEDARGELVFRGVQDKPIKIAPLYNRCVLFAPYSQGSEHRVNALDAVYANAFRYNVTSWYWSE